MAEENLQRRLGLFPATNIVVANSIILQSMIAIVLALSGTFEQVFTYMGFALGIFPILTVTGVFKLRKNHPKALRMAGFPFTQILYIATGILILFLAFLERPIESSIALLTVIAGIPAYYLFKRTTGNSND